MFLRSLLLFKVMQVIRIYFRKAKKKEIKKNK